MYYPVQIPYILNKEFSDAVKYTEESNQNYKDFLICFWEMLPENTEAKTVENIIITDGCIDLVMDFDGKEAGFAGLAFMLISSVLDNIFYVALSANVIQWIIAVAIIFIANAKRSDK